VAWWTTVVLLGTSFSNQSAAGEGRPARPGSESASGQALRDGGLVRERPWVGVVYFYWYTWDYDRQLGSWAGQGVHNTPLYGYYDSRTYRDNYRSLQLASEWGVTHHWMDYWAPTWKGEDGQMREKTVMRAAEDLRKAGYNIWMSYYQDGNNFEMTDFVKNVREKRDVHQWLRDFGRSPVWPRVRNRPMQLVYGRNGSPALTTDHAGFRAFLKDRYASIDRLNEDWGTRFVSFDAVEMDLAARGPQRAWSAKYQHEIWRRAWRELEEEIGKTFKLPGMAASFDVGYGPFRNLGYAEFARTFGGPHSYAGIFNRPHHQDAERFIQANVCKAYNTVFLDHYKNFYHDWDIRVPGMAYLPDPYHFDRFWVGDLMRYAEAVLHLSWNEWWEGSNLEPCLEWGKTYCQKQLFYSTIMQLCYESIRDWSKGSRVALLLNDYAILAGSMTPEDVTETLQALRRLNCDFDLVADDFVTAERLAAFKVVVAPSAGAGFGYNADGKRIAPILLQWVRGDENRRLIVSADEPVRRALGIKPATPRVAATQKRGDDLNLFVDVGTEGDERFVIAGRTQREAWGKLPAGKFGAGTDLTVRWTPGMDAVTTLYLPLSPNRDHMLRLSGSAIWPSTAMVRVDGQEAGRLAIKPGHQEYELAIPASTVGGRTFCLVDLRYTPLRIPIKEDPKRFGSEARRCNLALDWAQISTSNVPARTTKQQYTMPKGRVRFGSEVLGRLNRRGMQVPMRIRTRLSGEGARVLSVYEDGSPRDLVLPCGPGQVWYVNGLFGDVADGEYWRSVLSTWAGVEPAELVRGARSAGAHLCAGQTDLLLAYNYENAKPDPIRCRLPARSLPLSEALALSRDGSRYQPITPRRNGQWLEWTDTLGHYAVYQLAYAPVRVETRPIVVSVGQTTPVPARVTNLTDRTVRAKIRLRSVIPTLAGKSVEVNLWPKASTAVQLPVTVGATADWGRKTAVIEIAFGDQMAYLWREVVVLRPPELSLARRITVAHAPVVEVVNAACPFGDAAPALDVRAIVDGQTVQLGQIPPGGRSSKRLAASIPTGSAAATQPSEAAAIWPCKVELQYKDDRRPLRSAGELWVGRPVAAAVKFPKADAAVSVLNPHPRPLERHVVELALSTSTTGKDGYHLRNAQGRAVPAQGVGGKTLLFPATVSARGAASYVLCRGAAPGASTDLKVADQRAANGTITVSNGFYRVTIDRAAGGCVTKLVSVRTGKDYGLRSFDVNYGQFSQYDPNAPATNTVSYINERKTSLSQRACELKPLEIGPVRVVIAAVVADDNIRCRTAYEFRAYTPCFRITRQLRFVGKDRPEEIVVVDARFRRNGLTKSYPNFVGIVNDKSQPHFGWRYGDYVPDILTLMTPPKFDEGLSIILLRKGGLDQVRHGFWPAERPKSGPCQQARIELITRHATVCEVELVVYLHQEHQVAAARLLETLRDPPLVTLTTDPLWRRAD